MRLEHIPPQKMHEYIFTTADAARILGLDGSTIRWQIGHGRMSAKKIGRDWLLTPAEILRYGKTQRRKKCKH